MWWFIRESWKYLGCDRGTNRWRARRQFIANGWRAYTWWRRRCALDRIELAP